MRQREVWGLKCGACCGVAGGARLLLDDAGEDGLEAPGGRRRRLARHERGAAHGTGAGREARQRARGDAEAAQPVRVAPPARAVAARGRLQRAEAQVVNQRVAGLARSAGQQLAGRRVQVDERPRRRRGGLAGGGRGRSACGAREAERVSGAAARRQCCRGAATAGSAGARCGRIAARTSGGDAGGALAQRDDGVRRGGRRPLLRSGARGRPEQTSAGPHVSAHARRGTRACRTACPPARTTRAGRASRAASWREPTASAQQA